ncbi:MAG: FxLYD domain-containing protein [Deltaproteobacteria bacterium]|jgi:hypothetical protein|nr:FxLYD domain-containing protein [Deltaproteobacteria bacterium]
MSACSRHARAPSPALAFAAAAALALAGCAMTLDSPAERMPPPTQFDLAEIAPGNLQIPVTGYTWNYLAGNTHVRVQGTVFNDTGAPVQGVRLTAALYDQNGSHVASGSSYVTPTYLAAGGKGQFEFTGMAKKESGVTHTRLIVSYQVSQY